MAMEYRPEEEATDGVSPISPNNLLLRGKRVSKQVEDVLGIYGFMSTTMMERTGLVNQREATPVIETPDRAYGWERRWYDQNIGGLGGELNELLRRVVVHRDRSLDYVNPIPNNQPEWMPGDGALINTRRGDPYVKYQRGEVRLPGEAYERIHRDEMLPLFRTRASKLGRSKEEIIEDMLGRTQSLSRFEEDVVAFGTDIHQKVQKEWKRRGYLEASENRVVDQEHNISGHFDAILNINGRRIVVDIKTMGEKKYRAATGPYEEHRTQVNFYQHELGLKWGGLFYINRDNPADPIKSFEFPYDEKRYRSAISKVNAAKIEVARMINAGEVSRGELYDPVTRAEILAGIQPWSTEYKQALQAARKAVSDENDPVFKQELQERLQAAIQRGSAMRKQYRIYNYRFIQDTRTSKYRVKRILNANTFEVEGSKNPIRLAGITVSSERIRQWMKQYNRRVAEGDTILGAFYRSHGIFPGATIKVVHGADRGIAQDQLRTLRGAVYTGTTNLNRRLLREGVGRENKKDWSAEGVVARFSPYERTLGAAWERFAHLDLPWWNKLIGVNSALEIYKRKQVYGTTAGDWAAPWSTYGRPTLDAIASRNPLSAAFTGGLLASFFVGSRSAKVKAAGIGAAVGAGLSLYGYLKGALSGGTFIPDRVKKRRDVEEYYDVLKYLKYKRLEHIYAQRAEAEDSQYLEEVERRQKTRGAAYERKTAELEAAKRRIRMAKGLDRQRALEALERINQYEGGLLRKNRAAYPVPDNISRALLYRDKARRTLTGARPTDGLDDILAGFPRYERELISDIATKGTRSEKRELFTLLTRKQKAVMGKFLGARDWEVPVKEKLQAYFKRHVLPDASWRGWDEASNLDYFKTIAAQQEGINPIEMGIYPRNQLDAKLATADIPVPATFGRTDNIRATLKSILSAEGLEDVDVDIQLSSGATSKSNIDLEISHDRTSEVLKHFR